MPPFLENILQATGVELLRTPYQAPNPNAFSVRFVRSLKEESLDRLVLVGE